MKHRVKIRLTHTPENAPYKWFGECVCGWKCMSWSWSRSLEAAYFDKYEEEGNCLEGGTLVMALEHLKLLPDDSGIYPPARVLTASSPGS